MAKKNPCAKMRKVGDPYEVWVSHDGAWTWNVLKKWQVDDDKPYARWFCHVVTPMTGPNGDLGDVYVSEIKANGRRKESRGAKIQAALQQPGLRITFIDCDD